MTRIIRALPTTSTGLVPIAIAAVLGLPASASEDEEKARSIELGESQHSETETGIETETKTKTETRTEAGGEKLDEGKEALKAEKQSAEATGSMTADLVRVSGEKLKLSVNGAFVEVLADTDTLIDGEATTSQKMISDRLDKSYARGDKLTVAFRRDGLVNHATSIERSEPHAPGAKLERAPPGTVTASVIGASGRNLVLDIDGMAIQMRTDAGTRLNGERARLGESADRRVERAFAPGDEVEAFFVPRNGRNEASWIARAE